MKTNTRLLFTTLIALLCTSAQAAVLWRGDFETGDRTQYYSAQMVSADRLAIVSSPTSQGKYALKATVRQGDDPISASGNRNELVYKGYEKVGSEYWYRWRTMFAADYPIANTWALFTQWHQDADCCGSPPVSFYTNGNEIFLQAGGGSEHVVWKTPLARGVWHEFIFHVRWSPDPRVGFVELYYDGEHVLPKTYKATQQAGDLNYLKIGLYRDEAIAPTGVVYHDDVVHATTLEDVRPPPPVVTPPTTPSPTPVTSADAGTSADMSVIATGHDFGAAQSASTGSPNDRAPDDLEPRTMGCASIPAASSWVALAGLALLRRKRRSKR